MSDKRHTIGKEKDNTYSLICAVVGRTWPFNPPTQRVVMICPLCNKTSLDIEPLENDKWIICEDTIEP
jgi:hypothetical protein